MKKRIAILTPAFLNFEPGYSLSGVVLDQARMLERFGHEVVIYVAEDWPGPEQPNLVKVMPSIRKIEYKSRKQFGKTKPKNFSKTDWSEHKKCPEHMASMLETMPTYDLIFTHDIIYTRPMLPYYLGLEKAVASGRLKTQRWLHWIHSTTNLQADWWDVRKLGRFHKIIYPNRSDRYFVAHNFHGKWTDICVIPHIKDLRVLGRFLPDSWTFIDKYPSLLQADIVQVYPANCRRMPAKRVREVILIFGYLKQLGFSVSLVIANPHTVGRGPKKLVEKYRKLALRNGLSPSEVIFTSDFRPSWEISVPQDVLFDLMRCANLFVFPTLAESFGLALPEALLAGGCLPVINKDLDVLSEMLQHRGLRFRFGTNIEKFTYSRELGGQTGYFKQMAAEIARRIVDEESIAARSICRQTLNMDAIYNKYYRPIIESSKNW
jgi:glycosyltransferase involved in cell wall biosynthesis